MLEGYREEDGKLHVSVEYLKWLQAERARFDKANLRNVVLYEKGQRLEYPEARIKRYEITGLNNMDFVLTGWYETPVEDDPGQLYPVKGEIRPSRFVRIDLAAVGGHVLDRSKGEAPEGRPLSPEEIAAWERAEREAAAGACDAYAWKQVDG